MSIFTFNCKYNSIEAFLADKNYSNFIMKQGWFQSHKHAECRNQIAKYQEDSKKLVDDWEAAYQAENDQLLAIREKLYPQKKKKYAFQLRDSIRQSFRDDSNRSDALINRFRKKQSYYFKTHIIEELIAEALHPRRIQYQMNHYDNIEDFFEALSF